MACKTPTKKAPKDMGKKNEQAKKLPFGTKAGKAPKKSK